MPSGESVLRNFRVIEGCKPNRSRAQPSTSLDASELMLGEEDSLMMLVWYRHISLCDCQEGHSGLRLLSQKVAWLRGKVLGP